MAGQRFECMQFHIFLWIHTKMYFQVVFAPFTELQEPRHVEEAKLKNCARVLSVMLKTWPGSTVHIDSLHEVIADIHQVYFIYRCTVRGL